MRVVLDANVLISAFVSRGLAHDVFEYCLEELDVVVSHAILRECGAGLKRKFGLAAGLIRAYLGLLEAACVEEEGAPADDVECRDPKDLHVLGLAAKAGADVIVTGDDDLLSLHSFKDIPILTPRAFWKKDRAFRLKISSPKARYRKKA